MEHLSQPYGLEHITWTLQHVGIRPGVRSSLHAFVRSDFVKGSATERSLSLNSMPNGHLRDVELLCYTSTLGINIRHIHYECTRIH